MAFPSIRSSSLYNSDTGNTSHNVPYPATIEAGDILLAFASVDHDSTPENINWPAGDGWIPLTYSHFNWIDCAPAWKVADGTESGTTTVTLDSTETLSGIIYCIQDADTATIYEAVNQVTSSTPTPACPTLAPGIGVKDFLWITFCAFTPTGRTLSAYPANYTLGQIDATTGTNDWDTAAAGAARQLAADSETPGNYTITSATTAATYTFGIAPEEGAPPGPSIAPLAMHHQRQQR